MSDIKCPACRQVFYETTDEYDPERKATGAMLRLKSFWSDRHFDPFGDGIPAKIALREKRKHWSLLCFACGSRLCNSKGKLLTVLSKEEKVIQSVPSRPIYSDEELEREWNERLKEKYGEKIETNMRKSAQNILANQIFKDELERNERNIRIIELKQTGMSNAAIGREVGLSGAMIGKILNKEESINEIRTL